MLARTSTRFVRSALRSSQLVTPVHQRRLFSTEEPAADAAPTKEEVAAGQAEWGIKYDDECLKFEKEWKEIADKVTQEQMSYLDTELSDLQKAKVDMLADKVLDLNAFEMRYFHTSVAMRLMRTSGINPLKLNLDWPSVK